MERWYKNDLKYKYMNFDFNKFYICNRYIIIINKLYNIYGINIDQGMYIKKLWLFRLWMFLFLKIIS